MPSFFDDDVLESTVSERINRIDSIVIAHDALQLSIQGIKRCIAWSETAKEPASAILTGHGGVGKTTVRDTILRIYRSYEVAKSDKSVRIVPAYGASIPSPTTLRSTITDLLKGLGDPFPERGSAYAATERLVKLLGECETKIILLDEFHHLSTLGQEKTQKEICKWLKTLINKSKVMVCLIGEKDCFRLVSREEELSRRFARKFQLSNLNAGTRDDEGPLCAYLRTLSSRSKQLLGLKELLSFDDFIDVLRVELATRGNPSFISILFKEAIFSALYAEREEVARKDFALAFDLGITDAVSLIEKNPFLMSDDEVLRAILPARKKKK
ncbi:hypothetical protein P3T43_003957 [Paraburkholderia sp. GAS41]|uniref:TniB family NTP-binding protein n=1 Tax=Paraburkholderia sp. GAS41 TaxID=3035134 RepID=UPI003D19EC63